MLSGYGFYSVYQPVKLHFTTSYNALKYKNHAKSISKDSFHNRKDCQRFEYWGNKLQSKEEALEFCVFNFANNASDWFYGDFDSAKAIYLKTKAYYGALTKNLKDETTFVEHMMKDRKLRFSDLIKSTESKGKPPLLQLLLLKRVSKEFLCFLDNGFLNKWLVEYNNDPLIKEELVNLTRYKQFAILLSKRRKDGKKIS